MTCSLVLITPVKACDEEVSILVIDPLPPRAKPRALLLTASWSAGVCVRPWIPALDSGVKFGALNWPVTVLSSGIGTVD